MDQRLFYKHEVGVPKIRKDAWRYKWKSKADDVEDIIDAETDFQDHRSYTSSEDSPVMSYRFDRKRYHTYAPVKRAVYKEKSMSLSGLAKFFLFSSAMILFCVLMYIPVYSKVNLTVPKDLLTGWSKQTNRDTKVYIQPENITTIHEPKPICSKDAANKLFLLIVVCSATDHFEERAAIRNSWGNYNNYIKMKPIFSKIKEKYKKFTFTELNNTLAYDNKEQNVEVNVTLASNRTKRSISFGSLLPHLAEALKNNINDNVKTEKDQVPEEEKRFDNVSEEDEMLPEFSMNKVLAEDNDLQYNYDEYDTNVMKIPPNGYEDTPNLGKILAVLKNKYPFTETSISKKEVVDTVVKEVMDNEEFKLVFLLGLPAPDNGDIVQEKIEEEVYVYGDIIQEDFTDSYNNLTLKSVMMLKWIVNNCNNSVRYVLKSDDDVFLNMPNLMTILRNKSDVFDKNAHNNKEYLLIGDVIRGAKPIVDAHNKWYSPRYMFNGRVYPQYLSGTGYVFSFDAAAALYKSALRTPLFHLEDIYITGICAPRSSPPIRPRDEPGFYYQTSPQANTCDVYQHITSHGVLHATMATLLSDLLLSSTVDLCERMRLLRLAQEKLRPKLSRLKVPRKKKVLTFNPKLYKSLIIDP